ASLPRRGVDARGDRDRPARRHRRRAPSARRPSAARGRQHRADGAEPRAARLPAAGAVHRRRRPAHRGRGAGSLRAAPDHSTDGLLTWVERQLSPGRHAMPRVVPIAVATASLLVVLVSAGLAPGRPNAIVIGSKNFTEQVVLGELLAQTLERAGLPVTRRLNLGGSFICDRAIRSGDIDAYVEYTGTALAAILKQPVIKDPDAALESLREAYGRV